MFEGSKDDDSSLEDDKNAFKQARMRSKTNKSQLDDQVFGERIMGERAVRNVTQLTKAPSNNKSNVAYSSRQGALSPPVPDSYKGQSALGVAKDDTVSAGNMDGAKVGEGLLGLDSHLI